MKRKAIGSVLVMAVLAPNGSAFSPQKKTSQKRQSGTAVQTSSNRKRLAIEKRVRMIIVDELGVELTEIKPQSNFIDDLKADSLDTVELVMRFEEEFGIEISDEDAEKIMVVQQAYDYLVAHVTNWPKTQRRKTQSQARKN